MRSQRQNELDLLNPLTLLVMVGLALGLGFSPLLGTPGAESAFILGAVGAPFVFFGAVRRGVSQSEKGFVNDVIMQLMVLVVGLSLFALILWIQSFSLHACVGEQTFVPLLLGTIPVFLLNTVLGLHFGRLFRHKWLALALAGAAWVGMTGFWFLQWHSEPSFRFASQLLGILSGDLFQGLQTPMAAYPYRLATMGYVAALVALGTGLYPRVSRASLSAISQRQRRYPLWLIPVLLVSGWLDFSNQQKLVPSHQQLTEAYHFTMTKGAITVHANPNHLNADKVAAILAEATLWHERIKARLQLEATTPIHVWLHANDKERGRWTGAHHVDFALPWRGELHIAEALIPHNSLGHELVHVMAAELNDSLFAVPSQMGIWVNPGLTEGLAMAITPELTSRNGLLLEEQAAAMMQTGTAIKSKDLLSFSGFWQQAPARAYTLAGALIHELLRADDGLERVKEMYRSGDAATAMGGKSQLKEHLQSFEKALRRQKLPNYALGVAYQRFSRESILKETCDPDQMARAKDIRKTLSSGSLADAKSLAREYEPTLSQETLLLFARTLSRQKKWSAATAEAVASANALPDEAAFEKGRRWIYAGDLAWLARDTEQAGILWGRALKANLPPSWARLAKAKNQLIQSIQANAGIASLAHHALDYLLTPKNGKPDPGLSLALLERALHEPTAAQAPRTVRALVRYLVARQFVQRGAADEGVMQMLFLAENHQQDLPREFYQEVLKGLAEAHLRRGDYALGVAGYEILLEDEPEALARIAYRDRIQRGKRALANPADQALLGLNAKGGY